jgi:hypothetical protein
LRTFLGGYPLVMPANIDVVTREAPWERFHATVDGLLERITVPGGAGGKSD